MPVKHEWMVRTPEPNMLQKHQTQRFNKQKQQTYCNPDMQTSTSTNIKIQTNVELKTDVLHKWFVVSRTKYTKPRLDCELIDLSEGTRPDSPLETIPEFPLPHETFFANLDDFYAWEAKQPFALTTYCIEWLSTLTSFFF